MKTVYKYSVVGGGSFFLDMPEGARILSVQTQRDAPCIWALVDTNARKKVRQFILTGTGQPISCETDWSMLFIGTFQLLGGDVVLHLFEVVS